MSELVPVRSGEVYHAMVDRLIVVPQTTPNKARLMAGLLLRDFATNRFNPEISEWQVCSVIEKDLQLLDDRRYKNLEEFSRVIFGYGKNSPAEIEVARTSNQASVYAKTIDAYITKKGLIKAPKRGVVFIGSDEQVESLGIQLIKKNPALLGAYILGRHKVTDYTANRIVTKLGWQQIEPKEITS